MAIAILPVHLPRRRLFLFCLCVFLLSQMNGGLILMTINEGNYLSYFGKEISRKTMRGREEDNRIHSEAFFENSTSNLK